jgi:hypothetical protein
MVIYPYPPPPPPMDGNTNYVSVTSNGGTYTSTVTIADDSTATTWDFREGGNCVVTSGPVPEPSQDEAVRPPVWPEMFIIWEEPVSLPVNYKDSPRVVQHLAFTIWSRAPPGSSGLL